MGTSTDLGCYRVTGIGEALTESLEELEAAGILSEEDSELILGIFDSEMRKMLSGRNSTVKLLGDICHFKHVNDVWEYHMKELKLYTQGRALRSKGETKMVFPRKR